MRSELHNDVGAFMVNVARNPRYVKSHLACLVADSVSACGLG